MNPKFQIGEEVIVVSETQPSINGEYTIRDIIPHGSIHGINGLELIKPTSQLCYDVGIHRYDSESKTIRICLPWESELRKKYKPSPDSFETIMGKLKEGSLTPQV